jgi:class 3 adenylate cyclase
MIPDEPVRGRIAPPWVRSMSGAESTALYARGKLPVTPTSRLLGMRIGNVVPGTVTMTQLASQALTNVTGQLTIAPLLINAAYCTSANTLEAGTRLRPLSVHISAFRPLRSQPGNLVARARVAHSSRLSRFAEVYVEDPEGRSIAHGTMASAVVETDLPAPLPPATLPRLEEPVYETPDPYLRSLPAGILELPWGERPGLELLREAQERRLTDPAMSLLGVTLSTVERGRIVAEVPASEWFCNVRPSISEIVTGMFLELCSTLSSRTLSTPGVRFVAVEENMRFFHEAPADGRPLRCEARSELHGDDFCFVTATVRDADGHLVADCSGTYRLIDAEQFPNDRKKTERILATLLFADIVGSTERVTQMGDATWNDALEGHKLTVRRELSRYNGIEVATAGDGFFVRFESPVRAIEAARAIRAAASRSDIQIRAGIHTGECEIRGNTLAGIAVHLASRIEAAAQPGEILTSATVRDLVAGAGIDFADRGEHELKGIPDARRLYAVVDRFSD